MAFVESIINRHGCCIWRITDKVSYTLVTIMLNHPLLNSMSLSIDSDIQIIHTIRIFIGRFISRLKIPIIGILLSNRSTCISLSF
ncbi:unknown [Prevotella sp. CAG:732]|nr:unknown [Prevotella sp. CAG:732]